ncbi:MAG: hypothetical protein P8188_09250 [Gemmatimonadota bacterium]
MIVQPASRFTATLLTLTALAVAGATPEGLSAQTPIPTTVVVRAVANDAKLIGSGVGGARITIRDEATGEVLARGTQEGGTGDTQRIMGPRERGEVIFDTEGAAGLEVVIPLTRPRRVEIEARGPMGTPHARQRATTTLLLVPGEDMVGDGIVLTLHGFTVQLLSPETERLELAPGSPVPIRARVTLLCGCPTEPGGRWDADRIDIRAQWVVDGRVVREAPLTFSGTASEYTGELRAPDAAGPVSLRVLATDAGRANAGMDVRTGVVVPR